MLFLLACAVPIGSQSPLTVVSTSPSHGQVGVQLDSAVTAVFSAELDTESLSGVELLVEGSPVPIVVNASGAVLQVLPVERLEADQSYTLVLEGSLSSVEGSPLGSSVSARFDTGSDGGGSEGLPPQMTLTANATVDAGLWGWDISGQWTEPWMRVSFQGGAESCDWWAWLSDQGEVVFPDDGAPWGAWAAELEGFDTDCEGFDPSAALDGATIAIGYGPLSVEDRQELQATLEDWETVGPTLHTVWFGFEDGSGQWTAHPAGYGVAYALDADRSLLTEDGEAIPLASDSGDPGVGLYASQAWRILDTGLFNP